MNPDPGFTRHRRVKIVLPLLGAVVSVGCSLTLLPQRVDPPASPVPPGATAETLEAIFEDLAAPAPSQLPSASPSATGLTRVLLPPALRPR